MKSTQLIFALAIAVSGSALSAQNLLLNGSFEVGPLGAGTPPDWLDGAIGGRPVTVVSGIGFPDGDQAVQLRGPNGLAGIWRTVGLYDVGASYKLSFWTRSQSPISGYEKGSLGVLFSGGGPGFSAEFTPQEGWTYFESSFVAGGLGGVSVFFYATPNHSGGISLGPLIDDVRIVRAIPEPSTYVALVGVAAVAFVFVTRRRRTTRRELSTTAGERAVR